MGAHVSLQVSLGENCSLMKPRKHCEQDADASSIKCIQEAEFLVLSSIAVREQHKAKLCALISAVTVQKLPAASSEEIRDRIMKPQKSTKDKTNRTVSEIAEREELYVLGDLLLLARAASVDVVESIQKWREIVHQEVPRPYIYEHENYLLNMCEDLDFLDQVEDLVEWLGFRLVRNPFIVNESLDDIVSARLGLRVHDARSLKYWNSASWQRNKQLAVRQKTVPNNSKLMTSKSRRGSKARWKEQSPPRPLVKPLASIRPEDDVVDGSRITNAMKIMLDEESFHGRLRAFKSAQEYIDRGPSKFGHDDDNNHAPLTVYEAIAAVNSKLRYSAANLAITLILPHTHTLSYPIMTIQVSGVSIILAALGACSGRAYMSRPR
ncbi:unnamed protein product [Phytophthora lilii]|uniref:Unnamed protein product n=1 Tax=Phytophthora lilii TaxID=2077276 RepID=A0A9W6X2X4_9STRA|nr:unnamed protein product [Phytophthora lilii]